MISETEIREFVAELNQAVRSSTTGTVTVKMEIRMAGIFKDFLQHLDPDMPSAAMCRVLGPLVGDHLMNRKIERLDDLADKLGMAAMMLSGGNR